MYFQVKKHFKKLLLSQYQSDSFFHDKKYSIMKYKMSVNKSQISNNPSMFSATNNGFSPFLQDVQVSL